MEPKSERKAKNALREALASPGLPANGSGHGCDVSTTGAQPQQPFIAMTTLNSRLQLALLNRKKGRNLLEKGFTLVELMIVIVIVGILSAVALPNFLSQTSKAKATECTTRLGAILSQAGAEGLSSGTLAQKSATMSALADTHDSTLCGFTASSTASYTAGTNGTIFSVSVAGADALAGKYAGAGCVNVDTGVRLIDTQTDGTTTPSVNCDT